MASLTPIARACSAIFGLVLLLAAGSITFRELRINDRTFQSWSPPLRGRAWLPEEESFPEQVAAAYHGVFYATVYYTPLESAFDAESGYDLTPTTKPGLKGKQFPRDFLKAVEMEGFGRMASAVGDKSYVSSCRGEWGYAHAPLDSCGQPLQALRSTAVGADYEMVRAQASFRVLAEGAPAAFLKARWKVCDTGSGLKPCQIDFYWGEDAPLGPGAKLTRPRGVPDPIAQPSVLVLR